MQPFYIWEKYSPCEFGLYRSLVGEDVNKNDMFENLTLRKDEVKEEDKGTDAIELIDDIVNNKDNKSYTKYIIIGGIALLMAFVIFRPKRKRH